VGCRVGLRDGCAVGASVMDAGGKAVGGGVIGAPVRFVVGRLVRR
jgi:hypothetical protein